MANDLKQDEIDHLLNSFQGTTDFEAIDNSVDKLEAATKIVKKAKAVRALMNRLYFAMATSSNHEIIREATRDLHNEMFGLWCVNRGMDKKDYYALIKKELKRRGLRYISINPPGYKLVKA